MHEENGANGSSAELPASGGNDGSGGWPEEIQETGDESVDVILDRLKGLPEMPTASQTQTYVEIHDSLRSELDADGDAD